MNVLTKTLRIAAAVLLGITSGCSRKAEQVAPLTPEVLVTTVMPKDVPVLKEGVATLEGFITANINAQVQGYIISRDYKEGSLVKKGDLLFQIDPRPFEATLDQAKGNLAVGLSPVRLRDSQVALGLIQGCFEGAGINLKEKIAFLN